MSDYFAAYNCSIMRTGAEAVQDLQGTHREKKTVISSFVRGKKQGVVEEIVLNDLNPVWIANLGLVFKFSRNPYENEIGTYPSAIWRLYDVN